MMDPKDVLEKAAQIVETPGRWTKGRTLEPPADKVGEVTEFSADEVRCCTYGALYLAAGGTPQATGTYPYSNAEITAEQAAITATSQELRARGGSGLISFWNDEPGRTAEDVAATLRAAKERVESS